jgi:hypothetical protein
MRSGSRDHSWFLEAGLIRSSMQNIPSTESNDSVLDSSISKVKDFADMAGAKISTVNWVEYAAMSRPVCAWTCLGLSLVTLFLFGHFMACIYALVVGTLIGIMEVDVIYNMVIGAVPQIGDVKETFRKNGLGSDHPGSLGVCYVFASLPFFTGSFTPLYFSGLTICASGAMHIMSIFIQPQYTEVSNGDML